ncbi:MAG: hypothetical protein EA397_03760 [Deltaproteobacteria bacterium]|nr:MAG: hypothetical protein EA397_03760 [Deltaproteobacteria bacterium]
MKRKSPILSRFLALPTPFRALYVLTVGHGLAILFSFNLVLPNLIRNLIFPITDPYFPLVLRNPTVYALLIFWPALFSLYITFRPSPGNLRLWAWMTFLGGAVGLVHQLSFGWAEVLVMFWTGVWALWLAHVRTSLRWGPLIALLTCSLMFAYPAMGKLSPGFWTGELYWEFHWRHGAGIASRIAKLLVGNEGKPLLWLFGCLSIGVELLIAVVWLGPARVGFGIMAFSAIGIVAAGGLGFIGAGGMLVSMAASGLVLSEFVANEARRAASSSQGRPPSLP